MACILLIEDNSDITQIVSALLAEEHLVRWVSTLSEAREQLNTAPDIDLVLFDIGLPDGNGIEFLAALQARFEQRCIDTILLTGANTSALRTQGSRHWIITDGRGRTEEVKGAGVIGQQPRLNPGDSFEYESFCPLSTATGTMRGTYLMRTDTGDNFNAEIPEFFLVEPSAYH